MSSLQTTGEMRLDDGNRNSFRRYGISLSGRSSTGDLLQVENLFLRTKAIMRTRPIFHSSDAAIRGHVFCSFLALAMQKYLDDLSCEAGVAPEWKELLRDLDPVSYTHLTLPTILRV